MRLPVFSQERVEVLLEPGVLGRHSARLPGMPVKRGDVSDLAFSRGSEAPE